MSATVQLAVVAVYGKITEHGVLARPDEIGDPVGASHTSRRTGADITSATGISRTTDLSGNGFDTTARAPWSVARRPQR